MQYIFKIFLGSASDQPWKRLMETNPLKFYNTVSFYRNLSDPYVKQGWTAYDNSKHLL